MHVLKSHRWLLLIITCLLYANTLTLDYALDDALVITGNQFTKKGLDGIPDIFTNEFFTGFFGEKKELVAGGRYRPLTMAMFAVEHEFFGESPAISHGINVLLYALTVVLLYILLKMFVPTPDETPWYRHVPLLAAVLFAAHPLHTEAVANIKGRDEILTLLAALAAIYTSVKYAEAKGSKQWLWAFASFGVFTVGLFSKENCITFLVAIPIGLYYFRGLSLKQSFASILPLLAASALFLYVRAQVLGGFSDVQSTELMNDPFLGATVVQKYATIFYTWAVYIKLLVLPYPLTYDYYPYHIGLTDFANPAVLAAIAVYGAVACVALVYFVRSLNGPAAISLSARIYVWSAVVFFSSFSVVSNLLFPIGAFMNERFLYLPTVGVALAAAYGFAQLQTYGWAKILRPATIAVLLAFSVQTVARNMVWKDDFTLFTTDVKTSYNSAKSTCSAGGKLLERAKDSAYRQERAANLNLSLKYLRQSVKIHPKYVEALLLLGNCQFEFGQYDSTVYYYRELVRYAPGHDKVYDNLQVVLNKITDTDRQLAICQDFIKVNAVNYDLNYKLGVIWGRYKGDINQSVFYLERAVKIDSRRKEALKDLGVAYGIARRPADAERVLKMAIDADPKDGQTYLNLGVTYQVQGKLDLAKQMFARAAELDPKLVR